MDNRFRIKHVKKRSNYIAKRNKFAIEENIDLSLDDKKTKYENIYLTEFHYSQDMKECDFCGQESKSYFVIKNFGNNKSKVIGYSCSHNYIDKKVVYEYKKLLIRNSLRVKYRYFIDEIGKYKYRTPIMKLFLREIEIGFHPYLKDTQRLEKDFSELNPDTYMDEVFEFLKVSKGNFADQIKKRVESMMYPRKHEIQEIRKRLMSKKERVVD